MDLNSVIVETTILAIGQGNPGAITVIIAVAREHPNQFAQFAETCFQKGWLGPDLWVKFKECNKDVSELLRAN
jgi:hypothetical protein